MEQGSGYHLELTLTSLEGYNGGDLCKVAFSFVVLSALKLLRRSSSLAQLP